MDLGNSMVKTPEAETETSTRIQPAKASSFISNGVLKRHAPLHHHHHSHHPVVVTYKECLKNHAASLGSHAVDGCGEFMPSPSSNPAEPTSLKCAACGCHRNFHRREPEEPRPPNATPALEYQPHHRHHPPPPPPRGNSPNHSPSPPPISSSMAPHMLLALSHRLSAPPPDNITTPIYTTINATPTPILTSSGRKRFRTKFTQYQKDKMLEFAEKVEWKMQKTDGDLISEFCSDVGVDKGVFKVWMHNNKNTFGKKDQPPNFSNNTGISTPPATTANGAAVFHHHQPQPGGSSDVKEHVHDKSGDHALGTNGSSSS